MERYEEMSPKRDKSVLQLVEKYKRDYPQLDRDLLRKIIRLDNKLTNPSQLRKLDRTLKKAFNKEAPLKKENASPERKNAISDEVFRWSAMEYAAKKWSIFSAMKEIVETEKKNKKAFYEDQ